MSFMQFEVHGMMFVQLLENKLHLISQLALLKIGGIDRMPYICARVSH
jgi:hypothetical protein